MEKKKPLGFETPSMRLQEESEEILEQVMAKKTNWVKVLERSNDRFKHALKGAKDVSKSEKTTHQYMMELEHRVLLAAIYLSQVMVVRVGKELAECDIRISEAEKELKALRRGLK